MTAKSIFDHRKAFGAVICGVLCLLMLVGLAFMTETDAHAATVTASGTCGDNLTWELDDEGTLTISGSGEMTSKPWEDRKSDIKSVVIGDDVTSIVSGAFTSCSSLTSVTIGNSVTSIGSSTFENCTGLEEIKFNAVAMNDLSANNYVFYNAGKNGGGIKVTIGKDVTRIPAYLFCPYDINSSYSPKIMSVEFEEGGVCESIGDYAFYYCSGLTSVTIGNSVTSIGSSAFNYCSSLTSITIPDSVTSIGNGAFEYCSSLKSVTIGNSVTSIGKYAFYNCTGLTEIKFNTVAMNDLSANNYVFYNAGINGDGVKVIIGKNVTKVPAYLFSPYSYSYSYSPKITSVGFEEGSVCESIGNAAFSLCDSLTSVTIGNNVTSIGDSAFEYCNSLTSITIPNSVTTIGTNAFQYCNSIASINISDLSSWCVISFANAESNPLCATNSAKKLYLNGTSVTELTIPNGVTSIGNYAFQSYSSLTSVTIPDSVTSIGSSAFYCCNYIRLVVINSASIASSITNSAKCGDIASCAKTVAVKADITTIGSYITKNFTNINTFDIDGISYNVYSKHTHAEGSTNWTVSENGDKACSLCALTIAAPAPAKTEGYCGNNVKWAFDDETSTLTITGKGAMKEYSSETMPWYAYASQIKKVVIGEGVTSIGKNAFNNEKAGFVFPEISLPSTLTSIGRYAFYNCASLTEIALPASVDTIGRFAFRGTTLAYYTLGRCGKTADWMLDDEGTLIIYGDGAMYDYGSKSAPWASYKDQIKNVVVCEGVTYVGNCAFYECANITSISLPSTLTGIGNYAFYGCKALTEMTVPASVASIGAYAFRKCNSLITATFENADGWSYGDADAEISAEALKSNYKNAWTRA